MRYVILLITALASAADQPKPEVPPVEKVIETLKAENSKLKDQIEQMQRAIRLELQIRDGALQACREVALKPSEKPKPSVP